MTTPAISKGDDGQRDERGRFRRGWRGGPGNPGLRRMAGLQAAVRGAVTPRELKDVLRTLLDLSTSGDVGAARVLLERVAGPARQLEVADPLPVDLGADDLIGVARSIAEARSRGDLTDDQAAAALAVVQARQRIVESAELVQRIEALERGAS